MPGQTILVVDDEPNIVELARLYLEKEGFRVEVARDGAQALEMAAQRPPALMLMIAGLLKRSTGEILVGDRPVTAPITDVGIAFQDHLLLEFRTAFENVMLHADIRGLDRDVLDTKRFVVALRRCNRDGAIRRRQLQTGV